VGRSRLLVLAFGAMIVLPAIAFALIGYRSFDGERRAERIEQLNRVRLAFLRVTDAVAAYGDEWIAAEDARPWWEYEPIHVDPRVISPNAVGFRRSDLADSNGPPFVRVRFVADRTGDDIRSPSADASLDSVREHFRRHPLGAAYGKLDAVDRRHETVLMAAQLAGPENAEGAAWSKGKVPARLRVSYGRFRFFAFPESNPTSIFARRIVRWANWGTPGETTLVQGFEIDVRSFREGVFGRLEARADDPEVRVRLEPTPLWESSDRPWRGAGDWLPGLALVADPTDSPHPPSAALAARDRFVMLAAALCAVIAAGLWFIHRTVRAEMDLAGRKAEFVAAVSHELRTPLTGIRMYADMLRDGWVKDEETAQEYYVAMANESDRLGRLVQNVLDFSALERGSKQFAFERGSLATPVREAVAALDPHVTGRGFKTVLRVPDDLPDVDRDADVVRQIVINLIDNAVKYAASGDGERTITVALAPREGGVDLTVRDRGPGLEPEDAKAIFAPFERGRLATRAAIPGAGLGLALVRRFAESHGGTVRSEQPEGGGARFRVTFPT